MPSLSVAFEQQVEHEPDQNTEPLESQRESRKSGGSGASTSGSNGGEVITTHFENRCVCACVHACVCVRIVFVCVCVCVCVINSWSGVIILPCTLQCFFLC